MPRIPEEGKVSSESLFPENNFLIHFGTKSNLSISVIVLKVNFLHISFPNMNRMIQLCWWLLLVVDGG